MAADDRSGSGSAWSGGGAGPDEGDPRAVTPGSEPQQSLPPQPTYGPPPGFGQPGLPPLPTYGPPGLPPQPGFGPQGYPPQPGFVPQPGYPPQPGFVPQPSYGPQPGFVPQPSYGTPGFPPQPSGWPATPYPPSGWGYPPPFGFAAFVPAGPAPGLAWGGIGIRFGALLIDAILMFIALVIAGLLADAAGIVHYADGSSSYSPAATAITWCWVAFFVCYHPACWYAFGRSIGQRALGLRIVRASDGQKLGLGAILIRYMIFAVCTGTVLLGIIAAVMANEDPFKRAWHDEAGRSVVVRRA